MKETKQILQNNYFATIAVFGLMFASLLMAGCSDNKTAESTSLTKFTLDNGMQVILKENHSSAMVTSLIFVKAGSKYENRFNNGVTHFLEHLLFNGTATQTQEELEHGIERLGGYINAFTRKEFTAYLVSMPKDFIGYGISTQADMLFNTVFPEDKVAKERGIVIEEIKKDNDATGASAEAFFEEKALNGTSYSRPILGYESIISNIPREAVIDYYKRFYAPNNMIALILGDFETSKMEKTIKSIFSQFPKVELPPAPEITYSPLEGKKVHKTAAGTRSTYIKYSIEAPHYTNSDYLAFNLIEDYLSDRENSPLIKTLRSGTKPLVTSVSAYLDTKEEFSRFNIEIISERAEMADSIIAATDKILESLSAILPSEELLNGYKVTRRCNEIYMSEKLHHYGFTIASLMAITGWDFFAKLQDHIDSVNIQDIEMACHNYLSKPSCVVTVIIPQSDEDEKIYNPVSPTAKEVTAYYDDKTEFPEYDLTAGKDFKMPEVKAVASTRARHASYLREVLDNGLTVIIKSNPDSRVFALNVIGKNRSANEPVGKDGITDFVNRMIEKGTTTWDAEKLAGELSSIGANVTLYDNPWIPYDDRYTTRRFSFMKFETIDQFTEKGIELFTDMIINPVFDSIEAEKVRSEMLGLLGRNSGSTYKMARNKFYATLFKGTPYAKTIEGNYRTISSIAVSDLKTHHKKIYSPENMIITVGTNYEPVKVMTMLKKSFAQLPGTGFTSAEPEKPADIKKVQSAHEKMTKEQVYIYLGNLLPEANSPDAPNLKVANVILSARLKQNLREKQSLAYSVGSSVVLDKDFGWLICSMGTGVKNFEKAKKGILAEIERLKVEPPSDDELEEAINSLWGSGLMARLSRINQAYYMGVNEYLGLGYNYDDIFMDKIRSVTAEQVAETAQKYFDTKNYVIATAGNI